MTSADSRLHGEPLIRLLDLVRGGEAVHAQGAVVVLRDVTPVAHTARLVFISRRAEALPCRPRLSLTLCARLVRAALATRALSLFADLKRSRVRRKLCGFGAETRIRRRVANLRR